MEKETRDKVRAMLTSNEIGMRKLGQRLCHFLRISYHVVVFDMPEATMLRKWWKEYRWYFLDDISEITKEPLSGIIIYKINLDDNRPSKKKDK